MRLSTQRDALFAQLQTVTRAASTRSAVQALSGVQVIAGDGSIELRATDMEIGLRVPLEGEVVRDGSIVLPARLAETRPSTETPNASAVRSWISVTVVGRRRRRSSG